MKIYASEKLSVFILLEDVVQNHANLTALQDLLLQIYLYMLTLLPLFAFLLMAKT